MAPIYAREKNMVKRVYSLPCMIRLCGFLAVISTVGILFYVWNASDWIIFAAKKLHLTRHEEKPVFSSKDEKPVSSHATDKLYPTLTSNPASASKSQMPTERANISSSKGKVADSADYFEDEDDEYYDYNNDEYDDSYDEDYKEKKKDKKTPTGDTVASKEDMLMPTQGTAASSDKHNTSKNDKEKSGDTTTSSTVRPTASENKATKKEKAKLRLERSASVEEQVTKHTSASLPSTETVSTAKKNVTSNEGGSVSKAVSHRKKTASSDKKTASQKGRNDGVKDMVSANTSKRQAWSSQYAPVNATLKGYRFLEQKTRYLDLLVVVLDKETAESRGTCHVIYVANNWKSMLQDNATLHMIMEEVVADITDPNAKQQPVLTERVLLDYYTDNTHFRVCSDHTVRWLPYKPHVLASTYQ